MHAVAVALVLLHGLVMRGPTKPVCEMTTPCSEPAAHAVLIFARRDAPGVRVRTDAHGRYAVRLRAGRYVVRVAGLQRIQRIEPNVVVVRAARRFDFTIDTGIR